MLLSATYVFYATLIIIEDIITNLYLLDVGQKFPFPLWPCICYRTRVSLFISSMKIYMFFLISNINFYCQNKINY